MMCCAITALLFAVVAALRNVVKNAFARLSRAQWVPVSLAIALMLAGGSALAARELDHAPPQSDLAAMLVQHICGIDLVGLHHAR